MKKFVSQLLLIYLENKEFILILIIIIIFKKICSCFLIMAISLEINNLIRTYLIFQIIYFLFLSFSSF